MPCYTKHYLIVKASAIFASFLVYMALSLGDHAVVPCPTLPSNTEKVESAQARPCQARQGKAWQGKARPGCVSDVEM